MSIVQSGGALVAIHQPWTPAPQSRGATLYGNRVYAYGALYRTQPNVRRCVEFLGRNIAQIGIKLYERSSDVDRVELRDHPVAVALRRPNPWTTRFRHFRDTVEDLCIYGDALWAKVRVEDRLAFLRVPWWAVDVDGEWIMPTAYKVNGSRGTYTLQPDQVVHFRYYNPENSLVGVSPLETLRATLAEEAAAAEYRSQFWRKAARIEGVVERPLTAPKWSDAAFSRFAASFKAAYSGDGAGGETAILEEGMTFKPVSFSAKDSQYLEARELRMEECAGAYHIPPPMIGLLRRATFSNIGEQRRMLYGDTLPPWTVMMEEEIELQVFGDYPELLGGDAYCEFNIAEKLKGSFDEQASTIQTMVGAPIMTRDEARARLNLPSLGGEADELVTPLNVLVGGLASPTDVDGRPAKHRAKALVSARMQAQHRKKHQQLLAKFFKRQSNVVQSAYGAAAAPTLEAIFDDERWDAELHADLFSLATATAETFGAAAFAELAGAKSRKNHDEDEEFDVDELLLWLDENALIAAENINDTTKDQLAEALLSEEPESAVANVFGVALAARAAQIAWTRVTMVGSFASVAGAAKAGATSKTWLTTSSNPRASHAAISGETVSIDATFSNGGAYPGDPALPAEEVANCACTLDYS